MCLIFNFSNNRGTVHCPVKTNDEDDNFSKAKKTPLKLQLPVGKGDDSNVNLSSQLSVEEVKQKGM